MIELQAELATNIPSSLLDDKNCEHQFFEYQIPPRSFVYFLIQDDQVVYVGQTINLESRIKSHCVDKKFDRTLVVPCTPEVLDDVERYWIQKLQPKYNGTFTERLRSTNEMWSGGQISYAEARDRLDELQLIPGSIAHIETSKRVKRVLVWHGIESIEHLTSLSERQLLEKKQVMCVTVSEINAALAAIGKSLKHE